MKAVVRSTYGSPDVLGLRETDKPELTVPGVKQRVGTQSGYFASDPLSKILLVRPPCY
jgi:hypothetical protein